MIEPYYQAAGVTIYHGNCLPILMQLPSESIDCTITDPPYSSGGMFRGDRSGSTTQKYVNGGQKLQHGDFSGDSRDQRGYQRWCALWLSEVHRMTKPGGICALFTDWRQLPVTTDALQAGGFIWRGIVPWDKTEAARPRKGVWRNQCEYLIWGSRGALDDQGECLPGVFRPGAIEEEDELPGLYKFSVAGSEKHHIAGKPDKLLQELVKVCRPGGTLLDCFCGSGSGLKAAKEIGRNVIGIEIEQNWCAKSVERCQQDVLFTPEAAAQPEHREVALL